MASAAYRHTARMTDERTGQVWDFTRKRGCLHSELTVSADAPPWAQELLERHAVEPAAASEALWNRVEMYEKRKDAQLAREIRIALACWAEMTTIVSGGMLKCWLVVLLIVVSAVGLVLF